MNHLMMIPADRISTTDGLLGRTLYIWLLGQSHQRKLEIKSMNAKIKLPKLRKTPTYYIFLSFFSLAQSAEKK